jgi:hypothetical protein
MLHSVVLPLAIGISACAPCFSQDWFHRTAWDAFEAASKRFCREHEQLLVPLGSRGEGWDVIGMCGCHRTEVVIWDGDGFSPGPDPSDGSWMYKSNCRVWGWPGP